MQPAPAVEPGGGARLVQQQQRQQAEDLRLARHQPVQGPGQRDRLRGEVAAGGLAAGGGQVALVEEEVDDREDLGQPVRQLVRVGDADRGAGIGQGLAGAQQPLRHRGLGDEKGPADLPDGQAADRAQRERHLRVPGERGVTAGEDQAQQLVVGLPVGSPAVGAVALGLGVAMALAGRRGRAIGAGRRVGDGEQGQLALAEPVPAEPVEGLAAGGGGQPAARVGGHAVARPVLDRLDERVLHRVLGQAEVPGPRGQRGPDPGRLLPVCALERFRGRLHGPSLPRRAPCPRGCGNRLGCLGLLRCGRHNHGRGQVGGRRGYQRGGRNLCSAT